MVKIEQLLENNRDWSRRAIENNPRFFADLAEQQNPDYLWIGCSDSRVSANMIVGLMPGEVFVHRNVANLVNHTDMNCLSVIQFAVEVLHVEHIIICGHYGCGGVLAALRKENNGLIDNWLRQIQETSVLFEAELEELMDEKDRHARLCELNVATQTKNVGETTIVRDAWNRGEKLSVHGWIYAISDGLIRNLDISISSEDELNALRDKILFRNKPSESEAASN